MSPFKEKDRNRHLSKEDTHEKMLTITYYQRNAYQNYSEVSPHTGKNGHHQKTYKQNMLKKMWRKGNLLTLLAGM